MNEVRRPPRPMFIVEYKTIEEFPNYEISLNGIVRRKSTSRQKKDYEDGYGTVVIQLSKNGKVYCRSVDKLVEVTFHPEWHK